MSLYWQEDNFTRAVCYSASLQTGTDVGMVTVVDLGAKTCIPCKMMVPVLDAMDKQYHGKAVVRFIDIQEAPEQASVFKIRVIPTQIFFDKTGKEAYRHEGYLDEKSFADMLDKLLTN